MVKKFKSIAKTAKIKFPSASKGKGDNTNNDDYGTATTTPSSATSSSSHAANIRAEYYASRNNSGGNRNSHSNPFDDDDDVGGGGRRTNPFESAPSSGNSNANPFDDSDSDGDNDPLAGFQRKSASLAAAPPSSSSGSRPPPPQQRSAPPPPPTRNSNPFGDTPDKRRGSNNPFGDDDDDDNEGGAQQTMMGNGGRRSNSNHRSKSMIPKSSGGNNPFGDSSSGGGGGDRKSGSNPFGDDDDDEDTPSGSVKKSVARSMVATPPSSSSNPFGDAPKKHEESDPFLKEMKAKQPPQFKRDNNNNNASSMTVAGVGGAGGIGGRAAQQASVREGSSRPGPPPRPPARGKESNSNPFDDDKNGSSAQISKPPSAMEHRPPAVPKPLISQSAPQNKAAAHSRSMPTAPRSGNNPFGDDSPSNNNNNSNERYSNSMVAGAGSTKKRWGGLNMTARVGGGAGGGGGDTESTRPILAGMDEDSLATNQTTSNNSAHAAGLASWLRLNKKEDEAGAGAGGSGGAGGGGAERNYAGNSARVGNGATYNNNSLAVKNSMANKSGTSGAHHMNNQHHQQHQQAPSSHAHNTSNNKPRKPKTKKKCRAYVTPWPFDNYHEVQEQMYEELASRAASEYSSALDHNRGGGGYASGEDDEKKDDLRGKKGRGGGVGGGGMGETAAADASKYYERPEELPSIKEAVNDLSLVDFEKKAEERAINIVSTWLFDAGLIDELLVNGAMATPQVQQQSHPKISSTGTVLSEKTSEGQEIGMNGFLVNAEGAVQKMDKETNKLRAMIQRDLSIINARLNDGVAASGLEVQELVNAVSATKDDIGRLRELTTYISDGQISDRDEFLLAKYPYLRKAINARRNINRCFRELEFFAHIPSTCERLRDDLHGGEWTAEEWATIRNVALEHVELEVMLVEAENSMKGDTKHNFGDALVDNFLGLHVQNVWELGDEIRMRIISGIGSAFELSMNNPAGMVALVEAVEVYERAAETFEKKRRGDSNGGDNGNRLNFTNMRAAALEQLYQDFELRGVDMFRGVHEHAADLAEEDDQANTQFTAVLKAATELVTEIDIVKHQMSPCFAPHWHVEALWSSCVAHVCSNHIVQQIGGPDGQNLPELSITQLLELVAWVEYFRETIEETFPEVASMRDTKKTYFVEQRPELFAGDKRTVNMKNATDSLAWVNNMLWEVHRLAQEEFLVRTRSQTDEWLDKVYGSETVKNQSSEGKLTTSLCEDVFSFSSVQLRTIRERLSKKSDALILAVCIILSHMRSKQVHARNNFLQDLETCCAASNDFTRMSEKCEDMISELMSQCEFSEDMIATLEASSNELMGVYSSDAVYSARSVHIYVFDPIEEEIGIRLFEEDWEEQMVDNDLAISLVRTLEDFHEDLEHYMDDFMVVKSVMSLMSATIIFYAKCLLQRAEKHRNNKRPYFGDVKRALDRMTGDIKVIRDYFEGLVPQMPSLKKNIEKEFEILATIHELMSVAAGFSVSDAEDFILVLQKRVRDVGITKHIVGDLWHLVAPTEERYVWELVESMEEQLVAIAPEDPSLSLEVHDRSYVKGLRLDEMAVKLYVKSRRNRPIKATAVESIVKNWRTTWSAGADEVNDEE